MFLLKWLGRKDSKRRSKLQYPMKLRLDGDWRLLLRCTTSAKRIAPLMSDISPTEINVRADWRWGQLTVGQAYFAELHLSPEEAGPILPVVVSHVNKLPVDFIYSATLRFDKLSGSERRQLDYFLRRLYMRERMGGSTQHLV